MVVVFEILLFSDLMIVLVRPQVYLYHYPVLHGFLYPLLAFHILVWPFYALALQYLRLKRMAGFQRNQLLYFFVAALIVHLTTNAAIMPVDFNLSIPPVGFYLLPINLGLLGYAISSARLKEFNLAISAILIHTVALLVIVVFAGLAISLAEVWDPMFLGNAQTLFFLFVVAILGAIFSIALPRVMPTAERVTDKLFRSRISYRDTVQAFTERISSSATVDHLLQAVVDQTVETVGVRRAVIFTRDDVGERMVQRASCGPSSTQRADLEEQSPLIRRLIRRNEHVLIDELPRLVSAVEWRRLRQVLSELDLVLCVPMKLHNDLVGFLGLSEKQSREMFYSVELSILERVASDTAFNLHYRRMQEEVLRKIRLVELGTIAAGIAHEIRNPMASIRTLAQLLPERKNDEKFHEEFTKVVMKDLDRINKVIESMLTFARSSPVAFSNCSAVELVEEAVLLVHARFRDRKIEVLKNYRNDARIRIDKQRFLQVLVNLLNNAVDAVAMNGRIELTVQTRWHKLGTRSASGDSVTISISDNGPGIPNAIKHRLFDPFFTTKNQGTGLGLSISQKIARDHGGIITVSSAEGRGCTFHVQLPSERLELSPERSSPSASIPV
jgi:two-component system, NtrC family, sensor histidine kinase HydH